MQTARGPQAQSPVLPSQEAAFGLSARQVGTPRGTWLAQGPLSNPLPQTCVPPQWATPCAAHLSNNVSFNVHSHLFTDGSWGESQGHTARELAAEIQTPFQLPSNTKGLVLTTNSPAQTVQVGDGKRASRPSLCPASFSEAPRARGCPAKLHRTQAPVPGPGEGLLLHSGPDCLMRKENLGWSEPQPSSMPSTTLWTQEPGQSIS